MMTLVTGGSKSGKSHIAESLLDGFKGKKYYIATMQPFGRDAEEAISRHREMRKGKGFITIEKYTSVSEINIENGCAAMLECLSTLCANEMFSDAEKVSNPIDSVIAAIDYLRGKCSELVIVTNDVGSDGIEYPEETMKYIAYLGIINRAAAARADRVIETVCGIPLVLKGEKP